MRIAKKVLAIVLAIVMVVGTFAIATSAAGEGKIYVTLKAQVMNSTGDGAGESVSLDVENKYVSTVRPTKVKTQNADVEDYVANGASVAYQDSSKVIEVKPGQIVWITTHLKSVGGVFPDALQGQVFYDTNLFITAAVDSSVCYKWEATNPIYKFSNETLSGGGVYGRVLEEARAEYTPADFSAEEDAQYNQYTWFSALDVKKAQNTGDGIVEAQDGNLVTFPIYVKPDAQVGKTGKIFTYSYDKLLGSYYPESDYSVEFGAGDPFEEPISFGSEMFDLSAASLTFKVVGDAPALDYSALTDAIDDFESRDNTIYTDDSWADASDAYNVAKALVDNAESQDDIDTAATNLKNALAALELKPVLNYTDINNAIASVPALGGYTTSTASAVSTALANAKSVKATATTQGELDDAAAALNRAVAALEAKANFANLNAALEEAATVVNNGYTADSWARFENAKAVAEAFDQNETGASQQAAVNAAANELFEAMDNFEKEVVLDYTAWNNAITKIPASTAGYTPASVAAYEAAKAAAEADYATAVAAKNQAALDAAAEDLEAAIALLKAVANKAALQAAIADAPEYAADMYANWDVYANALDAANDVYADANAAQADVDAAVTALTDAKAALDLADADYSAVEAALNAVPALDGYTAESAKAVEDAIAAVVYGKKKIVQHEVDAMAKAINDAVAALEKLANYEAVEAAKKAASEVNADLYVSMADVEAAVEAVVYGYGESKQADVDAMAKAINDAIAALVEKDADYTAVENAKKDAAAINRDLYTAASLDELDAAVAAVVEGKKISAQAEVDAMAQAIVDALAALKFKPTEGAVQETAASTDAPYAMNTFSVKVNGRPNKIRFVVAGNTDLTITFSREKARELGTIVSYNANDEIVNDLSREIAYEIWTVDSTMQAGTYYVQAKDNDGWEALDLAYIFEFKYSTDDKAVNSIEAVDSTTVARGEKVYFTVKTGADVLKVRTISKGVQATFADCTVENGVKTFEVYAKAYLEGDNTVSFQIKTADGWETIDQTVVIVGE